MPDISMCKGEQYEEGDSLYGRGPIVCPLRDRCYRYTATPERVQSYFATPPFGITGECEYFWKDGRAQE